MKTNNHSPAQYPVVAIHNEIVHSIYQTYQYKFIMPDHERSIFGVPRHEVNRIFANGVMQGIAHGLQHGLTDKVEMTGKLQQTPEYKYFLDRLLELTESTGLELYCHPVLGMCIKETKPD